MNRTSTFPRKCFVPDCPNTSSNCRNKVFVQVKESLKSSWCMQCNIPYDSKKRLYCCEDHLNLEENLEIYEYWLITKTRPELKSTARLRLNTILKAPVQVFQNAPVKSPTGTAKPIEDKQVTEDTMELIPNFPLGTTSRPTATSVCTQPIKIDVGVQCKPDMVERSTHMRKPLQPLCKSPPACVDEPSMSTSNPSSPVHASNLSSTSDMISGQDIHEKQNICVNVEQLVYKHPKMYIGVPQQFLWILDHIVKQSSQKVNENDIVITLMKIKLNDTMIRLSHLFNLSRTTIEKKFHGGLEVLTNFFQHLIFMPSKLQIKKTLPLSFKIRYSNVQCIIDAFEIEIEKPTNPLSQAQTWSQYKHCNTIKYLIGCTPHGYISYISKGFGGRISDKALVENSGLLDKLPSNSVLMADRGFKEIETLLITKNIKLLRPPSVFTSTKPTKAEVIETKVIASLRIHIERVIRRLREFRFLKPHSVVSNKHVGYLDDIVIIACGLINLQNELIKSK